MFSSYPPPSKSYLLPDSAVKHSVCQGVCRSFLVLSMYILIPFSQLIGSVLYILLLYVKLLFNQGNFFNIKWCGCQRIYTKTITLYKPSCDVVCSYINSVILHISAAENGRIRTFLLPVKSKLGRVSFHKRLLKIQQKIGRSLVGERGCSQTCEWNHLP